MNLIARARFSSATRALFSGANKFKKYAVLADINEPKKSCHSVRKTRAEAAAYAECTEAHMMAMFGWTDAKMPAHYIAKAKRTSWVSPAWKNRCLRQQPKREHR